MKMRLLSHKCSCSCFRQRRSSLVVAVHVFADFPRRRFVVRSACCFFFRGVVVVRNDVSLKYQVVPHVFYCRPAFAKSLRRVLLNVFPGFSIFDFNFCTAPTFRVMISLKKQSR